MELREAERKRLQEWIQERDAPIAFFKDGEALAIMRGSGVQKAKVYKVSRTWKRGFFGTKEIVHYSFYGYGWVLGELRNYILMDADRYDTHYNFGLIPVKPHADGYEYESQWERPMPNEDYELLRQAVKKLAGVPNDV